MGNTVVLGDVFLSVTAHVVRLLDSTVGLKRFTFTVLSTWGAVVQNARTTWVAVSLASLKLAQMLTIFD